MITEKQIEDIIKGTLVVQNKQSIKHATRKIVELIEKDKLKDEQSRTNS